MMGIGTQIGRRRLLTTSVALFTARAGPDYPDFEENGQVRKNGFSPVVDENTEILILGTLPSDMSIAAQQYYANPSNDFWKLVGTALDQTLVGLPYEAKIEQLKANRIGLWDAFHSCVRPGSMDGNIIDTEINDFESLRAIAPMVRLVCLNGKKAGKSEAPLLDLGYQTRLLPSSSAANRRNQVERERQWKAALQSVTAFQPEYAG